MSVKKTFGGKGCSLYGEGNSGLDAVVLGNGPQVGQIMLASETTKEVVPVMSLDVFGMHLKIWHSISSFII